MVSHVGWFFLLLRSEERECVLCHVDWLVLLLEDEEPEREFLLCHVGWLCPAADQWGSEKRARNG